MRVLTALVTLVVVFGSAAPAVAQLTSVDANDVQRRLHRADPVVSGPARRALVRKLAAVPQKALRLQAVGEDHGPADRLLRSRQRGGRRGAARHRDAADRASQLRLRDVHGERAHVLPDEPRARARGRRPTAPRAATACSGGCFAARCAPIADHPESILYFYLTTPRAPRRAGTSKASRCSSTPGWRAASAARRGRTTRWCSARWCATAAASTIRSASRRS